MSALRRASLFLCGMDIGEFADRFERFAEEFKEEAVGALGNDRREFVEYVQEQLYSGLNGREKPLRPTYLTDPYFKEFYGQRWKAEAERYMKWKKKIQPPVGSWLGFSPRPVDVPNLIITGEFYSSIYANPTGKGLEIGTRGTTFGSDIERKYGSIIFGISPTARKYYAEYHFYGEIEKIYEKFMKG